MKGIIPFFKWMNYYDLYPTGYKLRQISYEIKPQLDSSYTTFVSPRLMEYFIDLREIKSFDDKHYKKVFNSDKAFYLIFSNTRKFYNMRPAVVEFYYNVVKDHAKKGFCILEERSHEDAHLVFVTYESPLTVIEQRRLSDLLEKI